MIYLIRHGLDDERFIGGYSSVGLVDLGIKQIEESSEWILKQGYDIKKIYSSDITRAIESAKIIANKLNLDIIVDKRLREQNKGLLNGMNRLDAEKFFSHYLFSKSVDTCYPDGESLRDLYLRIRELLVDVSIYDKSLLVTHRGVINMIYYLTHNDELDMNKDKYGVVHGSVHELNLIKSKIRRIK